MGWLGIGSRMFGISDLFQWRRFVSHTLVQFFYWLIVAVSVLVGLGGVVSSLAIMAFSPFLGLLALVTSVLGILMGVILARIIAELVLVLFCISEHLSAIRNQRTTLSAGERRVSLLGQKPEPI
jgi:Domain of unknown function (DUF4282)